MTICGRRPQADSARRIAIWHCKCMLQMAVTQLVEAVQPFADAALATLATLLSEVITARCSGPAAPEEFDHDRSTVRPSSFYSGYGVFYSGYGVQACNTGTRLPALGENCRQGKGGKRP
jgi:hypothetical protein